MKYFVLIILFFAAMSFAQVGKYSHIVAGGFNKAGQRLASGFACWDQKASRYGNLPRASFTGGRVSDIATAGKGFLAVGSFTAVNGLPANGIAFFDGSKWCTLPHLNLYYYVKPNAPANPLKYPLPYTTSAGTAAAISVIGTKYYIYGGQVSNGTPGQTRPAFNQVGTTTTNVAGLVALNFDGTGNFTVEAIPGYETQGGKYNPNPETSTVGFPADSAPQATIGNTKFRAVTVNNVVNFYVHPSVGTPGNVWRWRPQDGSWLSITDSGAAVTVTTQFNISTTLTTFSVSAQNIGGGVRDFDHDGQNTLYVAGRFDNFIANTTTASVRYTNVAMSTTANGNDISWGVAANWNNNLNYNQANTTQDGAFAIAVETPGTFYLATSFVSVDNSASADLDLFLVQQYFIYKITNAGVTSTVSVPLGASSPRFDVNPTKGTVSFNRLSFYNGRLYVFGNFAYYTWFNNQNNRWPRHYTRCISNAVYYDGSDFVDAYGGFTDLGGAYPLIAANAQPGVDFIYVDSATVFYDIFSAGSVVAYNTDTKRWANLAAQRFTVRGNNVGATTVQGVDGTVNAVHFIKSQRSGVNDAVVVAGLFDWYGNQYLGSVAYLRTSNGAYEQIGGGLFGLETTTSYIQDQTNPIYRAGLVYDIEEIDSRFYAAGIFSKNTQGACLNNLASVSATNTGDVWAPLGAGCDNVVRDLIAKGNDLYVAGDFDSCGGVDGTRRVARYDTKKGTWWALQEGLEGSVYAMIWYRGNLLVGGTFTGAKSAPAAYRSGNTGLWEWDGKKWAPLTTRCIKDCDGVTNFNYPFVSIFDPASRSVNNVRSLRTTGGNLYIHATIPANGAMIPQATGVLVQYDGNTFKQYGTASGACAKQGCIASNNSEIIVGGFTRGNGLNNNYMQYNPDRQNWVDTYTGFDNSPVIVASASNIALSLFSLFLIIFLAF